MRISIASKSEPDQNTPNGFFAGRTLYRRQLFPTHPSMSLTRLTFSKDTLGGRRRFDASTLFSARNRKIAVIDVAIAKTSAPTMQAIYVARL